MLKKGISYGSIQTLAVLYLVVWTISPPLEIDMIYRILAIAFFGVWCLILMIRQRPLILEQDQIIAIGFMVAVILVVYLESGKVSAIIKQISIFMTVICYVVGYYYRKQWSELSIIVPVVLILLIYFNYNTWQALVEDPTIARRLVRDDESIYEYLRQGIGGYSLIYPQVCVFPALLQWTIKSYRRNNFYFVIGLLWLVSYVLVISNAGYSIAIFTTFVSAVLLFFYKGRSGVAAFAVALVIFGVIMLSILYSESFRNWLLEIFPHGAIHNKINDLVASSDSGAAEGSISSRITRYMSSIRKCFIYPVVGALWRDSGGGHSAVLDIFAKYGIFGGLVFTKIIYSVPNYYKDHCNNDTVRRTANATLVSILIVSVLDSFTYSFTGMILIVLPLLFEDIKKWVGVQE